MLGPIFEKYHLRYQFESRTIRFLKGIAHSSNYMVKTCFDHTMRHANSPIEYNLAFSRNTYRCNIMEHTLVDCLNLSRPKRLNPYQCTLIKELNNLLLMISGVYIMPYFTNSDMDNVIKVKVTELHYVVICIYSVFRNCLAFIYINNLYYVIHVYA